MTRVFVRKKAAKSHSRAVNAQPPSRRFTRSELALLHYRRGMLLREANELDGAIADFTTAIHLNGDVIPISADAFDLMITQRNAFAQRGRTFADKNDFAHALEDIDALLKSDAKNIRALALRAGIFARQGACARAVADLDAVIAIDPKRVGRHMSARARSATPSWASASVPLRTIARPSPAACRTRSNRKFCQNCRGLAPRHNAPAQLKPARPDGAEHSLGSVPPKGTHHRTRDCILLPAPRPGRAANWLLFCQTGHQRLACAITKPERPFQFGFVRKTVLVGGFYFAI